MSMTTSASNPGTEGRRAISAREEQFCTFRLGDLLFGVEVLCVQEVLLKQQMTRLPLVSSVVSGLINLRGQIVTAIDLRMRLGMPALDEGREAMNVVVRANDTAFSLVVDEIGDVLDVDPELFEAPPETLTGVARELILGAYKLDGQLLLVLDVDKAIAIENAVNR
jgi:purine-binding chemotaxis protein CheW